MTGERATRAQVNYSLRWADAEEHTDVQCLADEVHALRAELEAGGVRLGRIAEAHQKRVDGHGGTDGYCHECAHAWPCPTYAWATTGRTVLDPWNPIDDEEGQS